MGTEPARLQERLEGALGPAWGIEREVRLAARLQHPHAAHTPTEVGAAFGTLAYMAPAQVAGHPAMDHCADLFALGEPCPRASTLPATHEKRTLVPRDSRRSTPEVVFPPPTGGRFK